MMMQNARTVTRSVDVNEQARERAKTTPLRNEAQLNCVSLRSQLDCEVTGGAFKRQKETTLPGPLSAPPIPTRAHTRRKEQTLSRLTYEQTSKNARAVERS